MKIRLKDGTTIVSTADKADKVKKAINDGAIGIELDGKWFRADWVASIMPGGRTEAEIPESHQIEAPDHRGLESPAKEKLRKQITELHKKM